MLLKCTNKSIYPNFCNLTDQWHSESKIRYNKQNTQITGLFSAHLEINFTIYLITRDWKRWCNTRHKVIYNTRFHKKFFSSQYMSSKWHAPTLDKTNWSGHIFNLYWVQLSNVAPFCKNCAKLYFDVKHLQKVVSMEWVEWGYVWICWCPFFKKVPFS